LRHSQPRRLYPRRHTLSFLHRPGASSVAGPLGR
jgi:hypothetical protein